VLSAALLLVIASAANAAGLGKLVVLSAMGEAFRAEIDLLSYPDDRGAPTLRLASPEVYAQAGFRYNPALAGTRFNIRNPSSGRQVIDVASPRPLNEPFVYLLIEVESNAARIVRAYTALLDPPGYGAPQAATVEYLPAVVPAAPVVKPAALPARAAPQARAFVRPAPQQERLSDADAKTLAAMLERVAALETAVAQLQRQWEKPAAVAVVPAAPAAQAPAKAAPLAPPPPVTQTVREQAAAPVESMPRRTSDQDSLLNNALLVLAIGLLLIVAWLAWVVWGPPSKEAKPRAQG
jgi:hypothetical protein